MAYYQAQDRSGHIFEFSEPSVGYQEPSRRRRVLAGPIVFLLLCATVGLIVHSSFLSLSSEPTLAAANIADRARPEGVRDPEKEQGLEDIEDNDSAKLTKKEKKHHGTNLFTTFFPMSATATTPIAEVDGDEVVSLDDSTHFMTCLETNCEVAMKTIAKAYPSGSELLQCLAASVDGMTATTCWGASSPEEDSRNDEGQNLRICAICNGCIPGTVNTNECNTRSHTWSNAPSGSSPLTSNTTNLKSEPPPPPIISAPPHTPVGKYEAEKHHRARAPITNTTERKKKVGKPWVPMMSGGRQNATDKNFVNDTTLTDPVGHEGVIPTLAFETTEFAVSPSKKSKHHQQQRQQRQKQSLPSDKKRSRHDKKTKNDVYADDDENSPPFWTKYMNGGGQGGGGNYWGGESGGNGVSNTGKYRGRTPPPSEGNPWDRYTSGQQGGNTVGATESFFTVNQENAFPPMLAFQNVDDDEEIVAEPIVSYETTDLSSGPAQHTSVEVPAPSPASDSDGPVEPWSKYGGSAGGEGEAGGNPWDKAENPQIAVDTTELASSSSSKRGDDKSKKHSHTKKQNPFSVGSKHSSEPSVKKTQTVDHSTTSTVRHHSVTKKKPAATTTKTKSSTTSSSSSSSTPSDPTTRWAGYQPGGYQGQPTSYPGKQPGGSSPAQAPGPKSGHVIGGGGGVVPVYTDAPKPDGSSSHHKIAHKAAPLPPDAPHQHPTHDSSASATKTGKKTKQLDEHDELTRCMQVTCNAQVGQAGVGAGKNALACLSKTETKAEGADCLGKEDPANPANELRTCMICHKCIEGKLKDPSVCAKEDSSWNNAGAPWLG